MCPVGEVEIMAAWYTCKPRYFLGPKSLGKRLVRDFSGSRNDRQMCGVRLGY